MLNRRVCRLFPWLATAALVIGCDAQPQASTAAPPEITAPAPAANPQPDVNAMPVERAAPPVLKPVALGEYDPGNPVATAISGKLTIEDAILRGDNGASFTTERVAIVKGGDPYMAGNTYAQAMQIGPEDTVELRRVLEQTPPTEAPANAMCGNAPTGFIALAKVERNGEDVVKLVGLQGTDLPAASASGIALCASTQYFAAANGHTAQR